MKKWLDFVKFLIVLAAIAAAVVYFGFEKEDVLKVFEGFSLSW